MCRRVGPKSKSLRRLGELQNDAEWVFIHVFIVAGLGSTYFHDQANSFKTSFSDTVFGQIRIQGSVPRTKGDFNNSIW